MTGTPQTVGESETEQPADEAPKLFDGPVLVVDPGMHTAVIKSASADKDGRWAVTGSDDKTVRVWSLADGALLRTIRLPAGPGYVGQVYAVAMSPDGALIAAGGWTRGGDKGDEQIYLFDRETGGQSRRIPGLPGFVNHLTFSPDGRRLAAMLGGGNGLRVYDAALDWGEAAHDELYGSDSYGAAFATGGRLATTSYDGKVRLYAGDLLGQTRPAYVTKAPGGECPHEIAFSPDGVRLAVGYASTKDVDLLDGRTLAVLARPDLDGINTGNLASVAWSRDGQTLFAAGIYRSIESHPVLAWGGFGVGARRLLPAGQNTVMSLVPLPDGDLLVAAADLWLARLGPDGTPRWAHGPPKADFSGLAQSIALSDDGTRVGFGFEAMGQSPARFDVAERKLTLAPAADIRMAIPRQNDLPVEHWLNHEHPTLDGKTLPLDPYEVSRSLAVHPAGDRFVLGSEWFLRAFDARGTLLWMRFAPGVAYAVSITGDGRLVVAAYGDGTIRWHRMTDGVELLAFMPRQDRRNWVAWTPEGYYAATAGAHGVLRWHVNIDWDAAADSVPIADIPGFYRPAVLPLVLQYLETPRAIGLAVMAEQRRQVMLRTKSRVAPGARLHLLAIGISAYNEDYAKSLRLRYAHRDAYDLASAIVSTQDSLYQVQPQVLLDKDATKRGIMRALKIMRTNMQAGGGNDLAVVHFAGHGAMVDGKLYLLPYEVDARDDEGIKSDGLSADDLRGELLELAKYGRVLVLLDACHSGATTMNGAGITIDADALRTGLAAANVTVLTSSQGSEISQEDDAWQHGAFTKALLDAFNDPAADIDQKGLISTLGLAKYLEKHVPALTGGKQTPGMEVRFEATLFASGS
jgi:WD40 repeat protein/uncharacterized caspase-like protein